MLHARLTIAACHASSERDRRRGERKESSNSSTVGGRFVSLELEESERRGAKNCSQGQTGSSPLSLCLLPLPPPLPPQRAHAMHRPGRPAVGQTVRRTKKPRNLYHRAFPPSLAKNALFGAAGQTNGIMNRISSVRGSCPRSIVIEIQLKHAADWSAKAMRASPINVTQAY